MATAVTLPQGDTYDESRQLAWFDRYVGAQHDDTPELRPYQVSKLDALRADIVWLQERDRAGLATKPPLLGRLYDLFEKLGGSAARKLRGAREVAPPPGPFDAEYVLLDRLSTWYGGQYRGAIVFNFALAMLGAFAVAVAAWKHDWAKYITAFDVVCSGTIIGVYLFGRTPRRRPGEDVRRDPRSRRWHERWIQYRLLAERFRYAALLQPFAGTTEARWRQIIDSELEPFPWFDRYFLWRLRVQESYTVMPGDWRARLAAIMEHQARYHAESGTRRQHIVDHLERSTRIGFVVSAILLVVGAIAELGGLRALTVITTLLTALLTAIMAAVHGILRTTELARIADTSLAVEQRIRVLQEQLAAQPADAPLEDLAPIVERFCRLVTEEASGWNATLRDKDIPLAH